ncbi:fungal hydrophobin [Hygrophoropsis aurantiaca]|uniref:Fungal hydrophobin n=1 Tax=Hygrophoropsis aurantiaca TaxID=72124 RepID=A0ACB8AH46_9AGAM|nr:fungal hydrophobin [Hygrophoropsis aurantiaca]
MIASRFFALLPLAALALAGGSGTTQCNTGSASCCDSTQSAEDFSKTDLADSLGLSTGDVTGLVGLDCTPISVIGVGSGCKANQEPVCCTDNTFDGLVNMGCSPVNVNL